MVIIMNLVPLWNKKFANFYPYQNITSCDVLIIGGGITGLTTAYLLRKSSFHTVLIDKGKIGQGVTYKSTAKISYLQKDIYQKLEKYFNYDTSKLYFQSQKDAVTFIKQIISNEHIQCDFKRDDGYLFTTEKKGISKLAKERNLLSSFGVECHPKKELPISFPIYDSFFVKDSYCFDPKCYVDQLAQIISCSIPILEDTIAFNIESVNHQYHVTTNHGKIICNQVVIANHYPFFLYPSWIPFKNYIAREYINAAPFSKNYSFQAINIDSNLHSIRFFHEYLIYVSNQHRLTNSLDYQKKYQKSQNDFHHFFQIEPTYTWMNQDLMTNDYLPFIGKLSEKNSNIFVATGYNGWGMTNGTLAAKIISDSILGIQNRYQKLFSPSRFHVIGILNSLVDGCFSAKAYIQSSFYHPGAIDTIRFHNESYYIYVDSNGKKHIVKKKCPHMGCKVVFNQEELTWDCPCHGSRFDMDGNLLEGPAKCSIKK